MRGCTSEALKQALLLGLDAVEVIVVDDHRDAVEEFVREFSNSGVPQQSTEGLFYAKVPGRVSPAPEGSSLTPVGAAPEGPILVSIKNELKGSDVKARQRVVISDLAFALEARAYHPRESLDGKADSGWDLIRELRGDQSFTYRLGIFALTGFPAAEISRAAYHAGADAVIVKWSDAVHQHDPAPLPAKIELLGTIYRYVWARELLRHARKVCMSEATSVRIDDLRRKIRARLPLSAISQHVHAEWKQTMHMLELRCFAGPKESAVELLSQECANRYDW